MLDSQRVALLLPGLDFSGLRADGARRRNHSILRREHTLLKRRQTVKHAPDVLFGFRQLSPGIGRIAKIPTEGMPRVLFYLSGLLVWNYFSGVFNGVSRSFQNAKPLFSKVYFPRLVVPFSYPLSHLVFLGLNAVVFLLFYAWHAFVGGVELRPTWWLLAAPLLVVWIAAAALGFGLVVAALTTKYRDLQHAMPFILQVWMFSSPIIYSLRNVQDPLFLTVLHLNPVGVAVEAARYMLTGRGVVTWGALGTGATVIVAALVFGLGAFNRAQRNFVDTI